MFDMLVSLSEKEKRLIVILLFLFIFIFILVGLIGLLVKTIMQFQGKRVDKDMSLIVEMGVIDNSRDFVRIARKKNHRTVFAQMFFPLVFIGAANLFYWLFVKYADNGAVLLAEFAKFDGLGFNSLFLLLDWANIPKSTFFGLTLPSDWPPILNNPHFVAEAWPNYLYFFASLTGAVVLLVAAQAFIARSWRIFKTSRTVFTKNLDIINK